jgi:hypothetical protein
VSTRTPEHDDTLVVAPTASQLETPARRPRYGLVAVIVVCSLLVIAGVIYLVGYLMAGDKLPKEAVVSGVAVGGLTPEAAVEKLSTELEPKASEPIPVTANEKSAQVKPSDAGLKIDYEQSIAAAGGGRSLNPRHIVKVLTGGSSTDAVVIVDQAKLSKFTDGLAAKWDSNAADGRLRYSGATIKRTRA